MDYLLNFEERAFDYQERFIVLNLIINGLPSKPNGQVFDAFRKYWYGFKPYYKWTTF